jgi:hypothetical protein
MPRNAGRLIGNNAKGNRYLGMLLIYCHDAWKSLTLERIGLLNNLYL